MKPKNNPIKRGDLFRNTLDGDIYYIIHFALGLISDGGVFLARRLDFDEKNKTVTFKKQLLFISELNFRTKKGKKTIIKKVSQREYNSWPSWRKHFQEVPEAVTDLQGLAHSVSRLDYEYLNIFLFDLSICLLREAKGDKKRKRVKLAENLENASSYLLIACQYIFASHMICEKKKDLP